jgi:hypothetical protein
MRKDLKGDFELFDNDEQPFSDEVKKWLHVQGADKLQPLRDNPELLAKVRSELVWGTFGKEGDKPCKVRFLDDLETEHLENILITQRHIKQVYSLVIVTILKERYSAAGILTRVQDYLENSTE